MTQFSKFSSNENSLMEKTDFFSITTLSQNLKNACGQQAQSELNSQSIKRRLAINELTTLRWSLEENLNAFRSYEIPAIGVSWRKLLEYGVQRGVRKIREAQLPVSSLGWVGGFTGHNGFGFEEVVLECKRAIRIAAQIKSPTLTVVTGPQNGHIDSHANRLVCAGIEEITDLADSYGISISLQPMHPIYHKNWSFIHTIDDALAMIEKIGHPSLKLALNSFHVGDDEAICEKINSHVDKIGIVYLSDRTGAPRNENDRAIPGQGELPLRRIVEALETAGYDGWYETEVWSQDLWKMDHHDLVQCCLRSQSSLFSNQVKNSGAESKH